MLATIAMASGMVRNLDIIGPRRMSLNANM
jgi:hypothetical protein